MAGMMGNGGGMMGGPSTAESPPPSGLDAAARKGYEFTRKYCSGCHATPSPARHTADEWPAVIGRMERYMRQQGQAVPDGSIRESILKYLGTSSDR
jgi:cytochrome c553